MMKKIATGYTTRIFFFIFINFFFFFNPQITHVFVYMILMMPPCPHSFSSFLSILLDVNNPFFFTDKNQPEENDFWIHSFRTKSYSLEGNHINSRNIERFFVHSVVVQTPKLCETIYFFHSLFFITVAWALHYLFLPCPLFLRLFLYNSHIENIEISLNWNAFSASSFKVCIGKGKY